MAGMLRVRRSRGAAAGLLLILLGVWGGLIAFIGPYFHYAYTPDSPWTYTSGRLWLEILPGIATLVGGLILLASTLRPTALLGAWMAAIGGAWFVVGSALAPLWARVGASALGAPVGGQVARAVEDIGFFAGLGVVIVFVAAAALGRLTVVAASDSVSGASAKRVTAGEAAAAAPVRTTILGRVTRPKIPAQRSVGT
jgi:hypothetical protein